MGGMCRTMMTMARDASASQAHGMFFYLSFFIFTNDYLQLLYTYEFTMKQAPSGPPPPFPPVSLPPSTLFPSRRSTIQRTSGTQMRAWYTSDAS